jgi:lysophospholipid acyltransferase (LPLAT)-like uncharacterized protein
MFDSASQTPVLNKSLKLMNFIAFIPDHRYITRTKNAIIRIRKSFMKFKDLLYKTLYPVFGYLILHGICKTLRILTEGENRVRALSRDGQPVVFAFWHGHHFLLAHYMGNRNISVVVSPSNDGTLISTILNWSGFETVRGSSNRQPIRALVEAVKQMNAGKNLAFTVDGPKGPVHQVKPGAVYLAKKMQVPVVPVAVSYNRFWKLRSWDAYRIPGPFAKAIILFDTPYRPDEDLSENAILDDSRQLEDKLVQLTARADDYFRSRDLK